jgi:hypothetical protein
MRASELLHAMFYIRGITMNKQDAQREPFACRSVQYQRQVGMVDTVS